MEQDIEFFLNKFKNDKKLTNLRKLKVMFDSYIVYNENKIKGSV